MKLIENLIPILYVKDLRASISHYSEVLGFQQDWISGELAQVSRDGFGIMFRQREGSQIQEVWIGVEELDSLYHEFVGSKAAISQEPENHPWAYDMKVDDIDGNVLWFGTGPKE